MKKFILLVSVVALFFACNSNESSNKNNKKEKSGKEQKITEKEDGDEASDDPDASENDGWTSTQKTKGSKRYVQLIEAENNSIYEKNSEKAVRKLADCMIEKIAERLSFSEYKTIMDNFDANKKVSDLSPALQRKAKAINPFFKNCREDAGVEY